MQENFKKLLFVLLSSQIIYLLIHLQFLLGMPQAALSVQDSIFFFVLGLISYSLSAGNIRYYLIGMAVSLWPIAQLQYFYIDIFHKSFMLSELSNFYTLILISPLNEKILYISLFFLWISGCIYLIFYGAKNWFRNNILYKIIPILGIIYCSLVLMHTKKIEFWQGDVKNNFFFKGIILSIQSRIPDYSVKLSIEEVQESYNILQQEELQRSIYPISNSPSSVPQKKRPIFMIIFESFYDYSDLYSLFDQNPFPQEYLQLKNSNAYTGPNHLSGSFNARFSSLTGACPLQPAINFQSYETLASLLSDYGYKTIALEATSSTYSLSSFYPKWGFQEQHFHLFSKSWISKNDNINNYVSNFSLMLQDTPADIIPFYFGFTFVGHTGTCYQSDTLPTIPNINNFLSYFPDIAQKKLATQLLKLSIFNANRILTLKKIILKKYPNALIVFKADHYSPNFNKNIKKSEIPQKYKDLISNNPAPLPFFVIDGTNGLINLPRGFSPVNIPLMILAEANLPYSNTTLSLLAKNIPNNIIEFYGLYFKKRLDTYNSINSNDNEYLQIIKTSKAYKTISIDLYQGFAYTRDLLTNKKGS